jgi:hypothetical protein
MPSVTRAGELDTNDVDEVHRHLHPLGALLSPQGGVGVSSPAGPALGQGGRGSRPGPVKMKGPQLDT